MLLILGGVLAKLVNPILELEQLGCLHYYFQHAVVKRARSARYVRGRGAVAGARLSSRGLGKEPPQGWIFHPRSEPFVMHRFPLRDWFDLIMIIVAIVELQQKTTIM